MNHKSATAGGGLRIDAHVHVIGTDTKTHGCFISKRSRYHPFFMLWKIARGYAGLSDGEFDRRYVADLARAVEESGEIDRAVILGLDAAHDSAGRPDWSRTTEYTANDYVFRIVGERDCFLAGPSVHPARADALDELERCAARGAALIKWVPNSQGIDPAAAAYAKFYEKMAALGLPLLSHTGYEHSMAAPNQQFGNPERLARALDAGVTVIAAHFGASGIGHRVEHFPCYVRMLEKYPNLYGDLSAFTTPTRWVYLRRVTRDPALLARAVQGTDYPVPPMPMLFAGRLKPGDMRRLWEEKNYFTKEVRLKKLLGVPEEVFLRTEKVLRLPGG